MLAAAVLFQLLAINPPTSVPVTPATLGIERQLGDVAGRIRVNRSALVGWRPDRGGEIPAPLTLPPDVPREPSAPAPRSELAAAKADLAAAESRISVVSWGTPGPEHAVGMTIRDAALLPYRVRVEAAQR